MDDEGPEPPQDAPDLWDAVYEPFFGALLRRTLQVHGVASVDARMVESPSFSKIVTLWLATDVGLLRSVFKHGGGGELPSVKSTMIAWTDVRDVEVDTDVAAMSAVEPQRENPLGYAHSVKLTVQFPRIVIERYGVRDTEELGQFAAAMLRRLRR